MQLFKLGKIHCCISVFNLLIYLCHLLSSTRGYNLDTDHYLNFTGSNGSMFGYSVLLHKHENETWVLVGAPVANSSFHMHTRNPGAIFKCKITDGTSCEEIDIGMQNVRCGKTCYSETDNQWLGVSMSRQQADGSILVCGHRWKNIYYSKENNSKTPMLPHGLCYKLEADLMHSIHFIPCYKDKAKEHDDDYTFCQAGTSNFLMEDLIVMGAPGTAYGTGSVLVFNISAQSLSFFDGEGSFVQSGSYLGYSVGAGHFSHPDSTEVVGGAPQSEQIGKVCILKMESDELKVIFQATGKKLGSYFGASVCVVDLNSDGLSDLLVGAPMYSSVREEGRVYIYMNHGAQKIVEVGFVLAGSDAYAARFGEAITNLGDIDDDGYPDVAVGAPQEDNLKGAVYIYNGRRNGITQTYVQRITGALLGNPFKMFGQSVSGGIDVDGNGYPDIAVGAFLSDSAVVLRTRAVVIVEAFVILPVSVNRSQLLCSENGQPAVCINVNVCFKVQGRRIPGKIGLLYNLSADVNHLEAFPSRFYFTGNGTSNTTAGRVETEPGSLTCVPHRAFMRRDVRDIFTPILFEMKYELGEHSVPKDVSGSFPPLKPVQQRKGNSNQVANQTEFARYCAWVNCSTNLQVSASLVLPQSYKNMQYFALGEKKTVMLNVTLINSGDDAFLPRIYLRFPSSLFFIKVLDAAMKYVSCEITKEGEAYTGLNCSVGNLFINSLEKHTISFLLDVNQSSNAGDLNITVNTTCQSSENEDLLHDNFARLMLPLRYGVNLTVHGFVSPSTFIFGHEKSSVDFTEKFNFTFKIINVGPSKALGAKVEIDIPRHMVPYPNILLNILDVKTSLGSCDIKNSTNVTDDYYRMPKPFLFEYLISPPFEQRQRHMYCTKEDLTCLYITCVLGDMDVGKDASVLVAVQLNPAVLQIYPGKIVAAVESSAIASPVKDIYVLDLQEGMAASILLMGHSGQMSFRDRVIILAVSLFIGCGTQAFIIVCLNKAGFFNRWKKLEQDSLLNINEDKD
ncbi:integrin alpha-4-like isoform X2 [Conger conger]|uniref:integrin alpha-4-like isoform X2 n=1 Tax=Conger conger TaxID=82655 RepID=UPI002A5A2144|nr:integrin alpha-4-like isoform X2 [Conger conger]